MYRTKSGHQQKVEKFMQMAGRCIPEVPTTSVSDDTRLLAASLIMEEAIETVNALGFIVTVPSGGDAGQENADLMLSQGVNLELVADGCADIRMVTTHCLSSFGLSDQSIQSAVDLANLNKFGPGGHKNKLGKWIKPKGWIPPPIKTIVEEQRKEAILDAEMEVEL